jgi:hypothetical protein
VVKYGKNARFRCAQVDDTDNSIRRIPDGCGSTNEAHLKLLVDDRVALAADRKNFPQQVIERLYLGANEVGPRNNIPLIALQRVKELLLRHESICAVFFEPVSKFLFTPVADESTAARRSQGWNADTFPPHAAKCLVRHFALKCKNVAAAKNAQMGSFMSSVCHFSKELTRLVN